MTYWMIVTSPENYELTRKLRFAQQGVKSRHRRKAERMAPGDRVCWYLTEIFIEEPKTALYTLRG